MSVRSRFIVAAMGVLMLAIAPGCAALAQAPAAPAEPPPLSIEPPGVEPAAGVTIAWSVINRFRLFRNERDFRRQVEALQGRTVLEAEQALAAATGGHGWARDAVAHLCLDKVGQIEDQCVRDDVQENYLNPADHAIEVRLTGATPPGAVCTWSFAHEGGASTTSGNCIAPVRTRMRHGRTTQVTADIAVPGEPVRRASVDIAVRDLLIAGLGDSIASGDGNPDRPVTLTDDGFCFRRFSPGGKAEYFRPGRAGFSGDRACEGIDTGGSDDRAGWAKLSAHWMNGACHRSLYGYQLRAALALAAQNPHIAVTFIPLACTGATIADGLFNGQRSRELVCGLDGAACPATSPAQVTQLRALVARTLRGRLDLIFLTIGANDINFAGLVADIIIEGKTERALLTRAGIISTTEAAQATLDKKLPGDFARLRDALRPLVGGALDHVVYTSYGNPALGPDGPCPSSRDGFDVHPAFGVDGERLRRAVTFVQDRFLPALKTLVTCAKGACPASDAMTFVDDHQPAFANHGFCARAETDPPFDRECFKPDGSSFTPSLVDGANDPLVCDASAAEFRTYSSRARWIRTPNDVYFAAMTFPEGVSNAIRPSNLHDATWGVLSAVYGGAIHPSAEGHAAMADVALAGARSVLGLSGDSEIIAEPLPPLPAEGK
jgi:lysophospholipase L1-like esterase